MKRKHFRIAWPESMAATFVYCIVALMNTYDPALNVASVEAYYLAGALGALVAHFVKRIA